MSGSGTGSGEQPLFDAHLHIVDPRFPVVANQGYVPEPFTVADYRARVAALGVRGGAVVSGSFQAEDQTYLRAALAELGEGFVGVANLPEEATDDDIAALDAWGVRAARLNLFRGSAGVLDRLERLARQLWDVAGWHVELYVDAADLPDLESRLAALPKVSLDHLGMTGAARDVLLRLVARGVAVKASAASTWTCRQRCAPSTTRTQTRSWRASTCHRPARAGPSATKTSG